jgi:hypothetical protein
MLCHPNPALPSWFRRRSALTDIKARLGEVRFTSHADNFFQAIATTRQCVRALARIARRARRAFGSFAAAVVSMPSCASEANNHLSFLGEFSDFGIASLICVKELKFTFGYPDAVPLRLADFRLADSDLPME